MSTQINNMYRSTIIDYNDSYLTLKNCFTLLEGLLNLLIYKLNWNQGNLKKEVRITTVCGRLTFNMANFQLFASEVLSSIFLDLAVV